MKLSILIPIFNERHTLEKVIASVFALPFDIEIITVDDGSTDGSRELLDAVAKNYSKDKLRVHHHERNMGKGAAIRTALADARGEVTIIQDADLEYDPKEYAKLLSPIAEGRADVVYGSRFLGGPHRVLFFWHYLANKTLTFLSNAFNNINLTDMETCYKAFKTESLKSITLRQDRFGFEPEITAKIARRKYRIYEVPISYYGRDYSEGKKITWRDGIAAVYFIVRYGLFD